MESCTRITYIDLGHNKNCIFLFQASFRPNINPVYQQQQRKAYRHESAFYHFVLLKFSTPTVQWHLSKSFHRLSPFEVTSAFSYIMTLIFLNYSTSARKTSIVDQSRRGFDSFRGIKRWLKRSSIHEIHSLGGGRWHRWWDFCTSLHCLVNSDFHWSLFRRKYNFSSVFHKAYIIDVAAIYLVSTAAHRCPQRQRAVRDKNMFFEQHTSSTDCKACHTWYLQ